MLVNVKSDLGGFCDKGEVAKMKRIFALEVTEDGDRIGAFLLKNETCGFAVLKDVGGCFDSKLKNTASLVCS